MNFKRVTERFGETIILASWTLLGYSLGTSMFPGNGLIHICTTICGVSVAPFFIMKTAEFLKSRNGMK